MAGDEGPMPSYLGCSPVWHHKSIFYLLWLLVFLSESAPLLSAVVDARGLLKRPLIVLNLEQMLEKCADAG